MKETMLTTDCPPQESLSPAHWVDAYGDYLFNFAVGQVRDQTLAEDLVQDTFLAALKSRERFSGKSSERTWLTGILRHKIIDHLRKCMRERSFSDLRAARSWQDSDEEEARLWLHNIAADCTSPSRRIELSEFKAALKTALGALPPRIAQAFQLYEVEDVPNHQVCSQLQISESNLWVMLHRARKLLREQLADWWKTAPRMEPKSQYAEQ